MPAAGPSCRRGIFKARVLGNRAVCPEHYRLRLGVTGFPPSQPGQFVNIRCAPAEEGESPRAVPWPEGALPRLAQAELARRRPLLRRPFSLGGRRDRDDGTTELEIVHRVVGAGTAWLARVAEGQEVDLVGPLGNGFALAEDRPRAALIAGGTGIGPMLYLAGALVAAGKEVVAFVGAKTCGRIPLHTDPGEPPSQAGWPTLSTAEFAARGVPTVVATDDGSLGFPGLVHEAFARWLAQSRQGAADLVVYACGPEAMMRAIAQTCQGRGPRCQFALERHMACGIGTCQGCVCRVRSPGAPGWRYALVCRDGPVFPGEELLWD